MQISIFHTLQAQVVAFGPDNDALTHLEHKIDLLGNCRPSMDMLAAA